MKEYENQHVVITGSSKGLGLELAKYFLDNGAIVTGLSRSSAPLNHERFIHLATDISDAKSVEKSFEQLSKTIGRIEILVNNAAVAYSSYVAMTSSSSASDMLNTNIFGSFLVAKEALKLMIKKKYGRIIHIGSITVPLASPGGALYSATKAALLQFSNVLSKEVGRLNITSNVLGISLFPTEMWGQLSAQSLQEMSGQLSVQRPATIEDITHAVDFFVSKKAGYITGQIIYLGGVQ